MAEADARTIGKLRGELEEAHARIESLSRQLSDELVDRQRAQHRIAALEAEKARLRKALAAVCKTAEALSARLLVVHNDPCYQGVWAIAQLHYGPYVGATYTDELSRLNQALEDLAALDKEPADADTRS
jgi:DNA repair exonuclease SbcCD ATPase subunit